ncbi:efflux RND transporter periplasmic adaptor subunit [Novipirellula herctigrandis]
MSPFTHLGSRRRLCFAIPVVWLCCLACDSHIAIAQAALRSAQQTLIYDGFTEPKSDIMVAASDVGILRQMSVKVGDTVEKDQFLAKLDDEVQLSAVKVAEVQFHMKGSLKAAKAELSLNAHRVEMLHELAKKNMARPDELRRAEADLEISEARYLSAQEQIEQRKVELERYKLQLERRQIVAPTKGVISHVFREEGEFVSPSEPVVVRLLVIDKLIGVFNVPAEEIGFLQMGCPARVYLRSTGLTIPTTIHSIAPDIDGESGTVQVRVEIDNAKQTFRTGDRCTLSVSPQRATPSVSQTAIPFDSNSPETTTR